MLEQEMASVIRYILDHATGASPYYWNVPQNFAIPAIYFPTPELHTGGETFLSYWIDFVWYIKIFHSTEQGAYAIGSAIAQTIRAARNLIPLIAQDSSIVKGEWVRVDDPKLKVIDNGAAQLTVSWRSRRPYDDEAAAKAQVFNLDLIMKSGKTISDTDVQSLEQYAIPIQETSNRLEQGGQEWTKTKEQRHP